MENRPSEVARKIPRNAKYLGQKCPESMELELIISQRDKMTNLEKNNITYSKNVLRIGVELSSLTNVYIGLGSI